MCDTAEKDILSHLSKHKDEFINFPDITIDDRVKKMVQNPFNVEEDLLPELLQDETIDLKYELKNRYLRSHAFGRLLEEVRCQIWKKWWKSPPYILIAFSST